MSSANTASPSYSTAARARAAVRPYLLLVIAGFRQQSTYLLAAIAGLTTNAVFAFLKMAILLATLAAAGGTAGGYTPELMVSYVFLSQGMLAAVASFGGDWAVAERIRNGDIAVDFLRPLNVQFALLAPAFGAALYTLIPRWLPVVAVGALTGKMAWASEPIAYPLAAISLFASIALAQSLLYCVQAIGFWVIETRGIQVFYVVASTFLTGMFVPIGLFPEWLALVTNLTPFGSILLPPCDILSGRIGAASGSIDVLIQFGWLAFSLGVGHALTIAGRRRLEVQGG